MRIVAGRAKGRSFRAPEGTPTRPTSDRVREAVFSVLGSLGGVEGSRVLDLFAGSGAFGLEALSRGASAATFVERDRRATAAIGANLSALALDGPAVQVVTADAVGRAGLAAEADVVFADPPYAFTAWPELLAAMAASGFGGLAVLETASPLDVGVGWGVLRVKHYGGTVVTVARPKRKAQPG